MPGLLEINQTGKREDLADIYSIVDMKATPFLSRVDKSTKPTNVKFEWIVDSYESPKVSGTVDGTDVADYENAAQNRGRMGNYCQIFRRTAKVSRLAEELSNVAGVRQGEIALAAAKKLVELKRDNETTLLQNGVNGQADTGGVPYLMATLGKFIDTTGPTVPSSVPSGVRTPSASINTTATASLTETLVQTVLKSVFDFTGMNGEFVCFTGSTLRRAFTDFTRTQQYGDTNTAKSSRVFNFDGSSRRVIASTTVFEGDYGTIEIVSSNFIGNDYTTAGNTGKNVGYLVDMNKVHLRSHKKPSVERFPDLGGGPRLLIEAVNGLQVDNPAGLGAFKPAS
jgi:hypothetical protein